METPKRNHSEVEESSSPESPDNKRTMSETTEAMTLSGLHQAVISMQKQLTELLQSKTTWDSTHSTVKQLETTLKEVERKVSETESSITNIKQQVYITQEENNILKRKVQLLEEKSIKAEAYSCRDNLLFDGIPESPDENIEEKVKEVIRVKLKCEKDIMFVRVHRLPNKRRTTIAKFHYYKDRETVWGLRRNLKGENIWMDEDFPTEIRNRRQVLVPIYCAALNYKFEKDKAMRVSLVQDTLNINNDKYEYHQQPAHAAPIP